MLAPIRHRAMRRRGFVLLAITGLLFAQAQDASACVAVVADLSITKTDGVTTAVPGGSVTYTIVASNAGPGPVTGATVADTFPASLTVSSWSCVGAGGGTCTAGPSSGNISDIVNLPANGSVTYTATATINSAATGTLSNTATVTAPGGVADAGGNNAATDNDTLTPTADLSITKTDGVTSADWGGSVTYTITAANPGPSDVPGALVVDSFPGQIASVSWTCSGSGGGTCTAGPTAGNISDSVNLPAGGSVVFTAVATLVAGSGPGTLSNTATVTAPGPVTDSPTTNNTATDNDSLSSPAPTPIVTVTSPNGGESWARGSTHTIRWDYGNAPQGDVKIVLLRNGNVARTIVANRPVGSNGHGSFNWTLPANLVAGGGYKVRISTTNLSPSATDTSNAAFSIT